MCVSHYSELQFLHGLVPPFGMSVKVTSDLNNFCRNDYGPCDSRVTTLLDIAKHFCYHFKFVSSSLFKDPCED